MARLSLTGFDANNKTVSRVADGQAATDAVNRGQLDAVIRNLDWKYEVIAASTGNVNISAPGSSLDGVTLSAGMQTVPGIGSVTRVVIKDNTTASENGIYDWNGASSPLTRSVDATTGTQLSGSTVTVQRGTVNGDRIYRVLTDDTITIGTTSIVFGQVGSSYTPTDASTTQKGVVRLADTTETATGTDATIAVTPAGLASVLATRARKLAFDCVATTNPQTFTHNLNTLDIDVTLRETSTGLLVDADITATGANTVAVNFGAAPTAGQYRVIVMG